MYVGITRAQRELTLTMAAQRKQFGQLIECTPSRFLDDLPWELTKRKSDNVMSSVMWKQHSHQESAAQIETPSIEFNQAYFEDENFNQDRQDMDTGTRIKHPVFGEGTVISKSGDIAEVKFDEGQTKKFALSIAPLQII